MRAFAPEASQGSAAAGDGLADAVAIDGAQPASPAATSRGECPMVKPDEAPNPNLANSADDDERDDDEREDDHGAAAAAEAREYTDTDAAASVLEASGDGTRNTKDSASRTPGRKDEAEVSGNTMLNDVSSEIVELRAMTDRVRGGMPLTTKQTERAAVLIRLVAVSNPGALDDTDGLDLAPPPRPVLPLGMDKLPLKLRLRAVQGYITALQYNHTGEQYFSINKQRPLGRVMDTAKQIMRDGLPIKCVEAVFLGLHLTMGWKEIDRIPVSFKTQVGGKHVHRHIVLLVRCRQSGTFGALGISRRNELACADLEHPSITSVLTRFKEAYETWWHAILKVRLGLPVDHDPLSSTPICWRHCCITVAGKTWKEACKGFEEQSARSTKRLYEKWQMDGERYRPYAEKQSVLGSKQSHRPWQAAADALRVSGPRTSKSEGGTSSGDVHAAGGRKYGNATQRTTPRRHVPGKNGDGSSGRAGEAGGGSKSENKGCLSLDISSQPDTLEPVSSEEGRSGGGSGDGSESVLVLVSPYQLVVEQPSVIGRGEVDSKIDFSLVSQRLLNAEQPIICGGGEVESKSSLTLVSHRHLSAEQPTISGGGEVESKSGLLLVSQRQLSGSQPISIGGDEVAEQPIISGGDEVESKSSLSLVSQRQLSGSQPISSGEDEVESSFSGLVYLHSGCVERGHSVDLGAAHLTPCHRFPLLLICT